MLRNRHAGLAMILISSAAVGFAYLGMSQAQTLAVACIASVLGGAGNGVQWVAVMTLLQEATPSEYQARMSGLLESLGAAAAGRRLPARRHDRRARLPAHRLRGRGDGIILLVVAAAVIRPGRDRSTSTTTGSTMGRRLSRS